MFRSRLLAWVRTGAHAHGEKNPSPPVNIPIPTKIGSKMGGSPTPNGTIGFDPQPNLPWGDPLEGVKALKWAVSMLRVSCSVHPGFMNLPHRVLVLTVKGPCSIPQGHQSGVDITLFATIEKVDRALFKIMFYKRSGAPADSCSFASHFRNFSIFARAAK